MRGFNEVVKQATTDIDNARFLAVQIPIAATGYRLYQSSRAAYA